MFRIRKFLETDSRWLVARGWGWRENGEQICKISVRVMFWNWIMVTIIQLCKYTKTQWLVYFRRMKFMAYEWYLNQKIFEGKKTWKCMFLVKKTNKKTWNQTNQQQTTSKRCMMKSKFSSTKLTTTIFFEYLVLIHIYKVKCLFFLSNKNAGIHYVLFSNLFFSLNNVSWPSCP